MIGKILLHIGKNLSDTRHQRTSVVRSKTVGGFMVGSNRTPGELCSFYPHLSL